MKYNHKKIFSLIASIKYSYDKTIDFNYMNNPRPCHNFAFMLEGKGIITTDKQIITIEKGDVLYIPKNTTYSAVWTATPEVVFHSLHFNFQPNIDPLLNKTIEIQKIRVDDFDVLYASLEEIRQNEFSADGNPFFVLSAFYRIFGSILANTEYKTNLSNNNAILPAVTYIENNFNKPIKIEHLSNLCFLSPSRFFYLFKKQMGTSPIVYKTQIAIQKSMQDLLFNKNLSIEEISQRNGFKSIIYFERQFKKTTGKTPSQYRKEETLL